MTLLLSSKAEQRAKKAEDYPSIFGGVNLTDIRENVGEILKLIGHDGIFREYTLHDANHIDEMLKLVDKLIPEETAKQMKIADWLMIVLSCYFHDLGMLVTKREFEDRDSNQEYLAFKSLLMEGDKGKDYEEALDKLTPEERDEFLYQEFVRKHHAKRISSWIKGQNALQYGEAKDIVDVINELLADLEQVFCDDLAKVCLSHHEDDLYDLDKYKVNRVYGDDPEGEANLQYAALILRTADVLQIQKKRVPPVLYRLIDPSNPKSQEEWAKQAGVRAIKPNLESNTIEVHASFDKESAYFGLLAYLQQFAEKEIDRCHDWAKTAQKKGSKLQYPWKQIDSSQVEPRGFEGRSYSFELNQEKILQLLTGHTLYNDPQVAVREVLQNALDAVRFQKFLNPEEPMGKIDVVWDSKARRLTVRDTGTGMTLETIEKFLLNIGSSYYQSEAILQKHGGFSSISRFGIGVLSTFMIADEVRILTVHPDDEFARKLTLPSVVKSYLIQKISKDNPEVRAIGPHGTEVILKVRRSAEFEDLEALLRFWLVIPSCVVTCKIDDSAPMKIGFDNAEAVLSYYYQQEKEKDPWMRNVEVRTDSAYGIELAYMVSKSSYVDTWDFIKKRSSALLRRMRLVDESSDSEHILSLPPGMCVEGVRIRSVSAGYEDDEGSPWIFVNCTGRNAPKTNVVRSDVEQTPELDHALLQIYSLLGKHIQSEFERMREKGTGIVEAAWEANFIRTLGLEQGKISSPQKFLEAMSNIHVIGLEEGNTCRVVTQRELDSFDKVWSVDSRLLRNLEGICGTLGIDLPAAKIIEGLDKDIQPTIPTPRIMGFSDTYLSSREVSKILIYPEERSHRIDICWEKKEAGRWITVPNEFQARPGIKNIYITSDPAVSSECSNYDLIKWRGVYFILATSPVLNLLDKFGMNERFAYWLSVLIARGKIPDDELYKFKQHLSEVTGQLDEELLGRLVLPFERRFGDYSRDAERGEHIFYGY